MVGRLHYLGRWKETSFYPSCKVVQRTNANTMSTRGVFSVVEEVRFWNNDNDGLKRLTMGVDLFYNVGVIFLAADTALSLLGSNDR